MRVLQMTLEDSTGSTKTLHPESYKDEKRRNCEIGLKLEKCDVCMGKTASQFSNFGSASVSK